MPWITTHYRSQCKSCHRHLPPGQKAFVESCKKGISCAGCAPKVETKSKRLTMQQAFDMQKPL